MARAPTDQDYDAGMVGIFCPQSEIVAAITGDRDEPVFAGVGEGPVIRRFNRQDLAKQYGFVPPMAKDKREIRRNVVVEEEFHGGSEGPSAICSATKASISIR